MFFGQHLKNEENYLRFFGAKFKTMKKIFLILGIIQKRKKIGVFGQNSKNEENFLGFFGTKSKK